MTTFHFTAFLASLAAGIALPVRFEIATSVLFAAGFVIIFISDYARSPRSLPLAGRPRALRPRAQFRPLPLDFVVAPQAVEIRPIIHRLRETHRLAA